MSDNRKTIQVEVAYATKLTQVLLAVTVAEGCTVAEAIAQSGIKARFPEENFSLCKLGIWSRVVPETQILREGDRVELYRPLIADPKETRRAKANKSQ